MATATKTTRKPPKADAKKEAADGPALYKAVIAAAKAAKVGAIVEHGGGLYSRLQVDGKTVAYIVRGKTVASVYPNTLAASMPKEVTFRAVELGAHHYGRGEVVVAVASDADVPNAVAALKASVTAPPVPKVEKASTPATPVESDDLLAAVAVKPDPKPSQRTAKAAS